jgi:hypothetical protein
MKRIREILPGILKPEHKPLSPIQERLVSMPVRDFDDIEILSSDKLRTSKGAPSGDL